MQLLPDPKKAIQEIIEAKKRPRIEQIQQLLIEIDRLKAEIEAQKSELRSELLELFAKLEKEIAALPEPHHSQALQTLQECKLGSLEFLGILAETSESAILTTLESGEDIKETIAEITKELAFNTIDINVDPKHIKDVTTTILTVAANIAEASVNYADEILEGAILGTKQGIKKSIQKFNDTVAFTPDEARAIIIQNYDDIVQNLDSIDEIYLQSIQKVAEQSEPGIKEKILSISATSPLEKLAAEAQKSITAIKKSVQEIIKESPKINTEEAKRLGRRAFELAKEKLEETINAIKK